MDKLLTHTIEKYKPIIIDWLDKLIPGEEVAPTTIHKAMRYSVFNGGKRIRPIMAIKVFQWASGEGDIIFPPACAIEMIHTYSLIHDDLPAMDNDTIRRNKPTCHRVFGEAIAILAGDALCALAFEILAKSGNIEIIQEVARAIGTDGLVGGQVVDIEMEGKDIDERTVEFIHSRKTSALFVASARVGAILAGADEKMSKAITNYAQNVGLAFQIIDDILDTLGDQKKLGKDIGSDLELDKATYPKAVGMKKAKEIAKDLIKKAKNSLPKDRENRFFHSLADYIIGRTH